MALIFKCESCGGQIITRFLKPGETAKCRACGANTVVPNDSRETSMSPDYRQTIPATTNAKPVEDEGKVRSYWKVLGLMFVTLGIYWWVYLFSTLREMENRFTFETHETTPKKARPFLIAMLAATILGTVVGFASGIYDLDDPNYIHSKEYYIYQFISTTILSLFHIGFLYHFLDLMGICQRKVGRHPFYETGYWIMVGSMLLLSYVSIVLFPLVYLNMILGFVWLYMLISQINRIWDVIPTPTEPTAS